MINAFFCCLPLKSLKFLKLLIHVDLLFVVVHLVLFLFVAGFIEKLYLIITGIVYIPFLLYVYYKVVRKNRIKEKVFRYWIILRSLIIIGQTILELLFWIVFDHIVHIRFMFILRMVSAVFNLYYNYTFWKKLDNGDDEDLNNLFLSHSEEVHISERLFVTDRRS